MAALRLSLLLLCCVTPLMARACSVLPQSDGLHVQCRPPSLSSLPPLSPNDVVWLDLRDSHLTQLPHFQPQFLTHVHHLDVSHNALTEIKWKDLLGARELQSLDISYNGLRVVRADSFGNLSALNTLLLHDNHLTWLADDAFLGLPHLLTLNLQSNNLTRLSSETFHGLQHLTSLDLSYNRLETLDNNTFKDLISLRSLMVHDNDLYRLEPLAFAGLSLLTEISLDHNQLQFRHAAFPPGVFAPLQSVEIFSLVYNTDESTDEFPKFVFNDLVSVKNLSIDSFYDFQFGADFSHMSEIQTLDLHPNCRAKHLRNDTFWGFKNSTLQTIIAAYCGKLVWIDTCSFCDLPHLRYLSLANNYMLHIPHALLSLYGLQGNTMEEISLEHSGRGFAKHYTVDRKHMRYLRNICVRRLLMARSHLEQWTLAAVAETSQSDFARCIEYTDVSQNRLTGDMLALPVMFSLYTNLKSFLAQEQRVYSLKSSECILSNSLHCGNRGNERPSEAKWSLFMSPKLQYMNISSLFPYFNTPPLALHFLNATYLKTLDLSYGAFSQCLTTLIGLDYLETLDLSGNYCNEISDNLFDHLPSLRHLFLSNSHLTVTDVRTRTHRLLNKLTRLETLDLSLNGLQQIEGDSLPHQTHMQTLLLSRNSFQFIPIDIGLHPNLTVLDLSFNKITSLTSSERSSLDTLALHHPIRLRLHENPLSCACSNLDFLQWLWDTKVTLDGEGSSTRKYTCISDTGEFTDTEQVMAEWQFLWRRCVGVKVFGWTLAGFFLQMLSLLTVYLISRSWTHLKYAWNVLRRLRMPTRHDFRKDVYIAYADDDAGLACVHIPQCLHGHGVRLLLRHQEELPGSIMADNIATFIDESWKVMLLVTGSFARDEWSCGFTVHQAQRSITDTLPDRVLVVFLEDPRHLPPMASLEKLLRHYPERNVFHVPREAPVTHPVWGQLALAILR